MNVYHRHTAMRSARYAVCWIPSGPEGGGYPLPPRHHASTGQRLLSLRRMAVRRAAVRSASAVVQASAITCQRLQPVGLRVSAEVNATNDNKPPSVLVRIE